MIWYHGLWPENLPSRLFLSRLPVFTAVSIRTVLLRAHSYASEDLQLTLMNPDFCMGCSKQILKYSPL